MNNNIKITIGVYGMGRFGLLWSSLLARYFPAATILVANRSPFTHPPHTTPATIEEVAKCEVLFLCVAISALESVLNQLAPLLSPPITVIDTSSIKVYPEQLMKRILPAEAEIIGIHPMFGPDSVGHALHPLVFSPVRATKSTVVYWKQALTTMKCVVHHLSSQEHDLSVSYIQGFTHLIGRIANQMHLGPSEIATLGYQKILALMEQTCNDSSQLFIDLQHYNPYTRAMLKSFEEAFFHLKEAILNNSNLTDGEVDGDHTAKKK